MSKIEMGRNEYADLKREVTEEPVTEHYHEQVLDPWSYGWTLILALGLWLLLAVGLMLASIFIKNIGLVIYLNIGGWIVLAIKITDAWDEIKRAWKTHKEILQDHNEIY